MNGRGSHSFGGGQPLKGPVSQSTEIMSLRAQKFLSVSNPLGAVVREVEFPRSDQEPTGLARVASQPTRIGL